MAGLRTISLAGAGVLLAGLAATAGTATASSGDLPRPTQTRPVTVTHHQNVPPVPVVTGVRTGRHATYDRMVLDIRGALPSYTVRYLHPGPIVLDNGKKLTVQGRALLGVNLHVADGHDASGRSTVPSDLKPRLPELREIALVEDFEGYVSFGVGVADRDGFRVFELKAPNRIVVDIAHPLGAPSSTAPQFRPVGDVRNATLTNIRTGWHPAYDRVVFDLTGPGPGYRVAYRNATTLRVELIRATLHDSRGRLTYAGPRTIRTGLAQLRSVRVVSESADRSVYDIQLGHRAGFRVFGLSGPQRVVVDVAH